MHLIEVLYLFAGATAVIAMAPQIKHIFTAKQADEFSLLAWSTWLISQFITLIYSTTIGSVPLTLMSAAWMSFYILMISLIIKYRKNASQELTPQEAEANSSEDSTQSYTKEPETN